MRISQEVCNAVCLFSHMFQSSQRSCQACGVVKCPSSGKITFSRYPRPTIMTTRPRWSRRRWIQQVNSSQIWSFDQKSHSKLRLLSERNSWTGTKSSHTLECLKIAGHMIVEYAYNQSEIVQQNFTPNRNTYVCRRVNIGTRCCHDFITDISCSYLQVSIYTSVLLIDTHGIRCYRQKRGRHSHNHIYHL